MAIDMASKGSILMKSQRTYTHHSEHVQVVSVPDMIITIAQVVILT